MGEGIQGRNRDLEGIWDKGILLWNVLRIQTELGSRGEIGIQEVLGIQRGFGKSYRDPEGIWDPEGFGMGAGIWAPLESQI